jgi:XTP/dITP diphosphohydrolase
MKKMQLIFATNNKNKISEIQQKITDKIEFLSLEELEIINNPEETGHTFHENAMIKAKSVWDKLKINCFAEDSGLVVNALGGAPGIYSARYSGEKNDQKNREKVLFHLQNKKDKSAYFITIIALIFEGKNYFFEGKIEGKITNKPAGEMGFGYDSIFIPNGFNKTFAQMTKEEKNTISHRGMATQKLINFLGN